MAALGRASETPERLWNVGMSTTTAEEVASLAASARLAQVNPSQAGICECTANGIISAGSAREALSAVNECCSRLRSRGINRPVWSEEQGMARLSGTMLGTSAEVWGWLAGAGAARLGAA